MRWPCIRRQDLKPDWLVGVEIGGKLLFEGEPIIARSFWDALKLGGYFSDTNRGSRFRLWMRRCPWVQAGRIRVLRLLDAQGHGLLIVHPESAKQMAEGVKSLKYRDAEGLPVYPPAKKLPNRFIYKDEPLTREVVKALGLADKLTKYRVACSYLPKQRPIRACILRTEKGQDDICYDRDDVLLAIKNKKAGKTYPPAGRKSWDDVPKRMCDPETGVPLTLGDLRSAEGKPWHLPVSNGYDIKAASRKYLSGRREIDSFEFSISVKNSREAFDREQASVVAAAVRKETPRGRKNGKATTGKAVGQKRIDEKSETPTETPRWWSNRKPQQLCVGSEVVKEYRTNPPGPQATVLGAFERLGWPRLMDDPLPPLPDREAAAKRRRNVVSRLNERQRRIRFFVDSGRIGWELRR